MDWPEVKARLEQYVHESCLPVRVSDLRAALQRVEELERLEVTDVAGWAARAEAAERERDEARQLAEARAESLEAAMSEAAEYRAKLALVVEALGEIRGRCLAAKTHEVGPLEAKGRLTRILELACAALAAAKGER